MDAELEKLKNAIRSLSIDAARIAAKDRNTSGSCVKCESTDLYAWRAQNEDRYYKSVPTLTIYVRTIENYNSLHVDPRTNNWDSDYPGTGAIRKMWKEILRGHKEAAAYYDDDMLIFIYNDVERRLVDTVYQNRDLVSSLVKRMPVVEPKAIYCRSIPSGYRIAYATKDDYETAERNKEFDAIRGEIMKLIEENMSNISHKEITEMLDASFYHPEMGYFSWYGFARED